MVPGRSTQLGASFQHVTPRSRVKSTPHSIGLFTLIENATVRGEKTDGSEMATWDTTGTEKKYAILKPAPKMFCFVSFFCIPIFMTDWYSLTQKYNDSA